MLDLSLCDCQSLALASYNPSLLLGGIILGLLALRSLWLVLRRV